MPIRKLSSPKPQAKVIPFPVLKKSTTVNVMDIPVELLIDSAENPNEQDEATFDQIVQGIKEDGFDEPIIVVPVEDGPNKGKYVIVSGHHRKKGGVLAGMKSIPAIIKPGWDEDKRLIQLVRRNQLRGSLNAEKFTKLFTKLANQGIDKSVLQLQMGFTKKEIFDKLFKQVAKNLTPIQKKKLSEAKERVTSVDSFSVVLNEIFTEHGSELDHGMLCFKYGTKAKQNVYYIECDLELDKRIKKFHEDIQSRGLFAADVFNELIKDADLTKFKKSEKVEQRKALRRPAK